MAAVLVAAAVALVLLMVLRPWEPAGSPGSADAAPSSGGIEVDPARVAELEAAEAERAVENLGAAAELAVSAQERLLPVMDGLYEVLPPDDGTAGDGTAGDGTAGDGTDGEGAGREGTAGESTAGDTPAGEGERPTAAELGEWRDVVDEVAADVEALPSGSSEHNIVRNGLLLSTGLLGDTLDVVDLAGDEGAEGAEATGSAEGEEGSDRLYAVAGGLRTRAVDAWAVAAVQLDLQHIAADRGHLHAFLPLHSDLSTEGEAALPHADH